LRYKIGKNIQLIFLQIGKKKNKKTQLKLRSLTTWLWWGKHAHSVPKKRQ